MRACVRACVHVPYAYSQTGLTNLPRRYHVTSTEKMQSLLLIRTDLHRKPRNGSTNCWPWQISPDVASPICLFHVADGILLEKALFVTEIISNVVNFEQKHCRPAMGGESLEFIQDLNIL